MNISISLAGRLYVTGGEVDGYLYYLSYLFCFSPSWRLPNPLLGGLWRGCGLSQFAHSPYVGNEQFTFFSRFYLNHHYFSFWHKKTLFKK